MLDRKGIKKSAKQSVKKHYGIFVAICLIAGVLGTDFTGSLDFVKNPTNFSDESIDEDSYTGLIGVNEKMIQSVLQKSSNNGKQENEEKITSEKGENKILARDEGVFASVVNAVTSRSYLITIAAGLNSIFGAPNITYIILIAGSMIISFMFWFLFTNTYSVIMSRIFMEGKTYESVSIDNVLYLKKTRKWLKTAWTMCVEEILYVLWCFTIVGIFVKRYSYYMVPYIIAENPNINTFDAITLSRNMMNGHKWECFKLEISFIGWGILDILTMGLSGLLFSNPYKIATISEYYALLRNEAKDKKIKNSELLNDKYLFEKASKEIINNAYGDITKEIQELENMPKPEETNIFTKLFGVTLFNNEKEKLYEAVEEKKIKIGTLKAAAEGRAYPKRLYEVSKSNKKKTVELIHYMRHYSVFSLIFMFFVFSFIGWTWEVSFHLITDGEFVNRGIMHGPYVPIYGFGGTLILVILNKLRKYPLLEFISAIVLCGFVEYFTAYYLETVNNGTKWWDYTGYFLNLHGRICAEGLLIFGIGGMLVVYLVAPLLDNLIRKMNSKVIITLCIVLSLIFFVDMGYSVKHPNKGKGITDYAKIEQIQYFENI